MIDFILSQLSSWLGWLIAGAGSLAVIFFQRWRKRRLSDRLAEQDRAISTYKVKEGINRQDHTTDNELSGKIGKLREKVDNAESQEAGAGEVSGAINDYFLSEGEKH